MAYNESLFMVTSLHITFRTPTILFFGPFFPTLIRVPPNMSSGGNRTRLTERITPITPQKFNINVQMIVHTEFISYHVIFYICLNPINFPQELKH